MTQFAGAMGLNSTWKMKGTSLIFCRNTGS